MKKLNLKLKRVLTTLTLTAVVAGFSGVALIVQAEDEPTPPCFEMQQTASARLTGSAGLRFKVKIDKSVYDKMGTQDVTVGMLIFPNTELSGVSDDYANAITQKQDKILTQQSAYELEETGYYMASATIDVAEQDFATEYSAIAYVKEGETYTYATFANQFARSVNYIIEEEVLTAPAKVDLVNEIYPKIGNETPISISDAGDYSIIAENVEKGETYSGIKFKVTDDFTMSGGYLSIGDGFEGVIDGNGKTVTVQYAYGDDVFTVDPSRVSNLNFNPIVDDRMLLKIEEGSQTRFVNFVNDKKEEMDSTEHAKFVAAGADEIKDFGGEYTGNAVGVKLASGGTSTFSLRYSGKIPESASYVKFWLASSTYKHYISMECGEIFYTYPGGGRILPSHIYDCFGFGAMKAKENWVEYYCPIEMLKLYLDNNGNARTSLDFTARIQNDDYGSTIYFGDIEFVDFNWNYVDADVDIISKSYRDNANLLFLQDVEYIASLPKTISNQDMVNKGFAMNGYTGNAFKVSSEHNGWAHDVKIDVKKFTEEQLDALASQYTHLRVNFAWDVSFANGEFWNILDKHYQVSGTADNIKSIQPLVQPSSIGATNAGGAFTGTSSKNKQWQTYDIPIADFIAAAKAAIKFESSQTVPQLATQENSYYKNKVFLLCGQGQATANADMYLGSMKFVSID